MERNDGDSESSGDGDSKNSVDVHTLCKAATNGLIDSSTSQKYERYYKYFERFLGSLRERPEHVSENVAVAFVEWYKVDAVASAQHQRVCVV